MIQCSLDPLAVHDANVRLILKADVHKNQFFMIWINIFLQNLTNIVCKSMLQIGG
jgi:hypothetical protein